MDSRSTESVLNHAKDSGLIANFPGSHEVFVDLDSLSDLREFERRVSFFKAIHPGFLVGVKYTESKNGGTHAYVGFNRSLTTMERAAIQAILGSDPKREILSLKDLYDGQRAPVVFFEVPGAAYQEKIINPGHGFTRLEKFVKRIRKIWRSGTAPRKKNKPTSPEVTCLTAPNGDCLEVTSCIHSQFSCDPKPGRY